MHRTSCGNKSVKLYIYTYMYMDLSEYVDVKQCEDQTLSEIENRSGMMIIDENLQGWMQHTYEKLLKHKRKILE